MFVHNIDPVLLEIGALRIHYYGLMYAILFLSSYFIGRWYLKRNDKNPDLADNLLLVAVVAVIVGARLGHVFFYSWDYYSQNLIEILYVWEGGLASHGATITLIFAAWYMKRLTKMSYYQIGDLVVLGASLSVILIRIGNFINGEIVGRVTDVAWGVVFPCNGLGRGLCGPEVRHPVQLYESFSGVVIFGLLMWIYTKYKGYKPGLLSGVFLVTYFGARFFIEYFKEYDGTLMLEPFTNGQVMSAPLVIGGLYMLWDVMKKKKSS